MEIRLDGEEDEGGGAARGGMLFDVERGEWNWDDERNPGKLARARGVTERGRSD